MLAAAVGLTACGGGGTTTDTTASTVAAKQKPKGPPGSVAAEPIPDPFPRPRAKDVPIPSGPPPNHIVVKDIKEGWGPVVEPHMRLVLHFIGIDYRSHKPFEVRWSKKSPFLFEFDHGLELQGWEKGLPGMKVGGRRRLVVPSRLAYGQGAVVYVVDLLAAEKRPVFPHAK